MSESFVRRFAGAGLFCVLSLTAITGARILVLRERAGAEAAAALRLAADGAPARFADRMTALLASDRRWRALACYAADGTPRFGGVRTPQGIRPVTAPLSAAGTEPASLATVALRTGGAAGHCAGRFRALSGDAVYPVVRDTAVAAIALLAIGALTLVARSRPGRVDRPPPPALAPPPGFTPDTASSVPADPASGTTPRTRHERR